MQELKWASFLKRAIVQEDNTLSGIRLILTVATFSLAVMLAIGVAAMQDSTAGRVTSPRRHYSDFELDVIVNGRPLQEYYARGRTYVEALHGAEYELRVRNSSPYRVAVALSVDGLNTIDARHTSAWNASKWVI